MHQNLQESHNHASDKPNLWLNDHFEKKQKRVIALRKGKNDE